MNGAGIGEAPSALLAQFLALLAEPGRVQSQILYEVDTRWRPTLAALSDDDLLTALRALRRTISSPKRKLELDTFVGELRRDGLPGDARLPAPARAAPPPVPAPPPPAIAPSDDDPLGLCARIAATPDDPAPYLVYGDWLQSVGDPLGAWIAANDKLRSQRGNRAVEAERDAVLAAHRQRILGPVADVEDTCTDVAWFMGFIRACRVSLPHERFEGELSDVDLADVVRWLFAGPGRFLRGLVVGLVRPDDNDYTGVCAAIGAAPRPTLQQLVIGDFSRDLCELNWSTVDASAMWAALPGLEALVLRAGAMQLGDIELPALRTFATITGGLDDAALASIGRARWPRLEALALQIGRDYAGASTDPTLVEPILDARGLPNLRRLGLTNCEFTEDLARMLPTSKILPQLEALDLSMGTLDDESALHLVEHRRAFEHLAQLNLDDNFLTDAVRDQVSGLCREVVFGHQRVASRGHRYASAFE